MRWLAAVLCVLVTVPALGQQAVPDPRLEQALQVNVIAAIHDSVELQEVVPEPLETLPVPEATEPGMLQLERNVWVDRALVPDSLEPRRQGAADDAVRVTPLDTW